MQGITLAKVWRREKGAWARVEAGRGRRRLLTDPRKRCLVAWIRVAVMERKEVARLQIYFEGRQGLLIVGKRNRRIKHTSKVWA